jgi:NAD(P)H-hydrate epimerase
MGLVLLAEGVAAFDRWLAERGLLELTVENAGRSVAERCLALHPGGRWLVLAGSGNNGADALVAARHLWAAGAEVQLLVRPSQRGLPQRLSALLGQLGVAPEPLTLDRLRGALREPASVLDGLLGTGLTGSPSSELSALIGAVNASGREVLSIDLPSGATDRSVHPGPAVRPGRTLALGSLKPVHLYALPEQVGAVDLLPLALPEDILRPWAAAELLSPAWVAAHLPVRPRNAHKGTAGVVWILGGSAGLQGAPVMAALGALHAGSGLVYLFSEVTLTAPLEVMVHRLASWSDLERRPRPDAIAVGMGLGYAAEGVAHRVLGWELPCVIDADALLPQLAIFGHERAVWTPHPGEAARLLGCSTAEVVAAPIEAARELRSKLGGVIVLKGSPTTVVGEGCWVCPFGTPAMASGGMGDTLSGIIVSLLGQGLEAEVAALCGVYLHGRAAELQPELGYGLQASQVAAAVPRAWLELSSAGGSACRAR